jgi:hypothetical protein
VEFDAGQQLISDRTLSEEPSRQWSTSSLFSVLDQVARTRALLPSGELHLLRAIHGTSALAMAGERGLDPSQLMRLAFGRQIRLALDVALASLDVASIDTSGPMATWMEYRREIVGHANTGLELSEAFRSKVRHWVNQADPVDVFCWEPPVRELWDSFSVPSSAKDPVEPEFRWAVERLVVTYLQEWTDDSLRIEYLHAAEGWRPEVVPVELTYERRVQREPVNTELARRRVHGQALDVEAISALVERAIEAIGEGSRGVAASVFQAARTMDPSDQLLANNLAFCYIPDEPDRALALLEEARTLDSPKIIVEANVAVIHLMRAEYETCLEVCQAARSIGLVTGSLGFMWALPDPRTAVLVKVQSGAYLCEVAIQAAEALANTSAAAEWSSLLSALRTT